MGRQKRKKLSRYHNPLKVKHRSCPLTAARIQSIDYKDVELLKHFITEKGKILPRRIVGLSARKQTLITRAIKRARNIALLSFSEGYIDQQTEESLQSMVSEETKSPRNQYKERSSV